MTEAKAPVFKNISPVGALDVPTLGRVIDAGEEFEVTLEQAVDLYAQPDVWHLVSGLKSFEKLLPTDEPTEPETSEPAESDAKGADE